MKTILTLCAMVAVISCFTGCADDDETITTTTTRESARIVDPPPTVTTETHSVRTY
jgi:hypothetical protein